MLHGRGGRRTARAGPGPARPDRADADRDDRARAWPRSRSRPGSAACGSSTTRSGRSYGAHAVASCAAAARPAAGDRRRAGHDHAAAALPGAAARRRRCWSSSAPRAIPGVDEVATATLPPGAAAAARPGAVALALRPGYVAATLRLADVRDLAPAVARCRRLLDLDADPVAVDAVLAADPALAPCVAKEPGYGCRARSTASRSRSGRSSASRSRSPGARTDPGPPGRRAPAPTAPAEHGGAARRSRPRPRWPQAPDEAFGMPAARRATLRALAAAVADGRAAPRPGRRPGRDRGRGCSRCPASGRGRRSTSRCARSATPTCCCPPISGVRRGAAALGLPDDPAALTAHAHEHWAPWRSYATIRLWRHA